MNSSLGILSSRWALRGYAFLAFLGIWQLAGTLANPIEFSTPLVVAERLYSLMQNTSDLGLPANILITLQTMVVGFVIALSIGIPLGLAMGRNEAVEYALDLYVAVIYAIPGIILFPLLIVWIGPTFYAAYALVVIGPFFPILINTMAGAKNVSRDLIELGRSFGYNGLDLWRKVVLPSAVPYIVTGVRIGLASAILATLVSELFVVSTGLGFLLDFYSTTYDIPATLAVTVVVMIFGFVVAEVAKYFERRAARSRGMVGAV